MRIPAALCLFVLMCSAGAYAQAIAGFGAITGKVRDIYGDGIPDTTVTITNRALGLRLVLTTTDDGVFYAPALAPAAGYAGKVPRKGVPISSRIQPLPSPTGRLDCGWF